MSACLQVKGSANILAPLQDSGWLQPFQYLHSGLQEAHQWSNLRAFVAQLCVQLSLLTECQHAMLATLIASLLVILSHLSDNLTCRPSGTSTWRTACTCGAGRSTCASGPGTPSSGSMWGTTWCLATSQVSLWKAHAPPVAPQKQPFRPRHAPCARQMTFGTGLGLEKALHKGAQSRLSPRVALDLDCWEKYVGVCNMHHNVRPCDSGSRSLQVLVHSCTWLVAAMQGMSIAALLA